MTHLFFTGAAGLLGGQLLARLLTQGRQVAVLVRPTAKASGLERIETLLARQEEALGTSLPRPVVLEGDLTAPQCGLTDADLAWMRRACSAVLHSAASLEFVGKDRAADPWRTNVDGTRRLLELTRTAGIEEFHHVSTAYVCGLSPGPIAELPSTGAHGFRNDYEASKHEAESLVRAAPFLRSPTFFRPAVIAGDSRTGATTTYHGLMAMLQLMVVIVRNLPADETGFRKVDLRLAMTGDEKRNMIPVDWVAEAIARLLADPRARGRTIHLAPSQPITMRQVIDYTSSYLNSGGVEFCGPRTIDDLNDTESVAYSGKSLYEAYEQTDPVFALDNLRELLPDLVCPLIDEAMMHRFLAYGDADRWGKRRPPALAIHTWAADVLEGLSGSELLGLARALAGGPGAVAPAAIGIDIVGPGGGSWTISRTSATDLTLERGLAPAAQVFRLSVADLAPLLHTPSAGKATGHPVADSLRGPPATDSQSRTTPATAAS
jgi:thioester reductase-like protein